MESETKTFFEKRIKPVLHYIGTIGAVLMCIAYIVLVCIMVFGFSAHHELSETITFALVNALVGLIIMQLLKFQGIDFAKALPDNAVVLKKYYTTKTKDKKPHSLKFYWITSVLKDMAIKGLSIIVTTIGVIYIVIQGSNDYSLLLLAVVNLVMFICFGLLSLVNAYDFFNEQHIPFIVEKLKEAEENNKLNIKETENDNN